MNRRYWKGVSSQRHHCPGASFNAGSWPPIAHIVIPLCWIETVRQDRSSSVASTSTMSCRGTSGWMMMGAEVKRSFSSRKAASASGGHRNCGEVEVRAVIGAVKPKLYRGRKLYRLRNPRSKIPNLPGIVSNVAWQQTIAPNNGVYYLN